MASEYTNILRSNAINELHTKLNMFNDDKCINIMRKQLLKEALIMINLLINGRKPSNEKDK